MATIEEGQELRPLTYAGESKFGVERYIGLEIETTRDWDTRPSGIDSYYWDYNAEEGQEFEDDDWYDFKAKITDFMGENVVAMVGADGADIEITTEPMDKDFLNYSMGNFFRKLHKYFMPEDMSGTHVHVSKLDSDNQHLPDNLYWFSMVYDKQLYKIFKRKSHWALSPKSYYINQGIKEVRINDENVRLKKNNGIKGTIILERNNTYECRGGRASTDGREIKLWANFFMSVVEHCNCNSIVGDRFEDFLNDDIKEEIRMMLTGEEYRQICPKKIYL